MRCVRAYSVFGNHGAELLKDRDASRQFYGKSGVTSPGVKLVQEADENTKGPASLMAVGPDGNQILLDQHV